MFISKYMLLALVILSIVIMLMLNLKTSKIYKKNAIFTVILMILFFMYCFRNRDISTSIGNGTWFFVCFAMVFCLQFSQKWIKTVESVIAIFSFEHLFFTIFFMIFRDFYGANILPLFHADAGYSDLVNQYRQNMVAGFTGNYGSNANYLIFGFFLFFTKCFQGTGKMKKSNVILCIIFFIATLITGKRGTAVFGLITAIIAYFIMNKDRFSSKMFKFVIIASSLTMLIIILSAYIPELNTVLNRLTQSDDLLNGRGDLYDYAIKIFFENPLLGIGWGNFKYYYAANFNRTELVNVHNIYIQLFCELGIFGAILVSGLMFFSFFRTLKIMKCNTEFQRELRFSMVIQLYILLVGICSTPLYSLEFLYVYLVSCVIPIAVSTNVKNKMGDYIE